MTSWSDVERAAPEFAATVHRTFAIRKHATMATIQRDGAPRISGTEVDFADDGEIYLGMMTGARRALDLRRDPRVGLHCPTEDPPDDNPGDWLGDGKISAWPVEVSDPSSDVESHRFRLDIARVVLTTVAADASHLEITTWDPDRGLRVIERF